MALLHEARLRGRGRRDFLCGVFLDLKLADAFRPLRHLAARNLNFVNITFRLMEMVLQAADALVGDEAKTTGSVAPVDGPVPEEEAPPSPPPLRLQRS